MKTIARHKPINSTEILFDDIRAVVYLSERNEHPIATAYSGRRSKPDFCFRFKNEEARDARIQKWVDELKNKAATKKQKALELSAKKKALTHDLVVGDLLISTSGYDETYVTYHEIVGLKGRLGLLLRETETNRTYTSGGEGYATPIKGVYRSDIISGRFTIYGSVSVSGSHVCARKHTGKPAWFSIG